MKTQVQSFSSDHVEEGTYVAKFLGRKGPVQAKHGGMLFWEFQVKIDGEEYVVAGVSSTAFSTDDRCKAHRWAKAVDPEFTDESIEWDDENAVGLEVQIAVEDYRTGEDVSSRVIEVLPCQAEAQEQE